MLLVCFCFLWMDLCTQPTRTSSAQSISYSPSSSVTFRHFCDSKCQSVGSHLAPTHWFPWGSPVAAVIWTLYKWLADNVGSVCLRVFFFFLKRLPCWQNNCFVTQRWLLAVCICWTALSSQAPTAGLWFSVFVWLLCHGNDRSKRPRNTCRCFIGFQPQQHQQ